MSKRELLEAVAAKANELAAAAEKVRAATDSPPKEATVLVWSEVLVKLDKARADVARLAKKL